MKQKQIRKFVGFLGEFHKRHKQLPPAWDNILYDLSQRPGDLMKFIAVIEIEYPAALKEMMRLQQAGDGGECEDEPEHPHHPGKHKPQKSEPLQASLEYERVRPRWIDRMYQ